MKSDRERILASVYELLHAGGDEKSNWVNIIVIEEISRDVVRVDICHG